MNTCLYVASIPYSAKEINLIEFFEEVGEVVYAKIIYNKETHLSRGFGFVEMANEAEAIEALKLDGALFGKRKIVVKEAIDDYKKDKNNKSKEV